MPAPTGYTTVSASNIKDATGTPISNATIWFQPVLSDGTPTSFRSGGTEGQTIATPVTATVIGGAFSCVLADTSLTTPVNVAFATTVIDNLTGKSLLGHGYLIQPTGSTWSFDTYVPNLSPQVSVIVGGQGPTGPPLLPQGVYSGTSTYATGYVVTENGSSYISLIDGNVGHDPATSASQWMLLASKGDAGTDGTDGSLDGSGVASLGQYATATQPSGRNLLDLAQCTANYVVGNVDGTLGALTSGTATGFIPCAGADHIYITVGSNLGWLSTIGHAFYDLNRTFISGGATASPGALAVPSGAAYFRQSVPTFSLSSAQVVLGSTAPTGYTKFGYDSPDAVDAKIATAIDALPDSASVQFVRDYVGEGQPPIPNLFDLNRRTVDHAIHPQDGTLISFTNLDATDFIRVFPGETYTTNINCNYLNSDYGYAYYDENKVYVSGGTQGSGTFTVPSGVHFYRQYVRNIDETFAMIVRGSTLPSTPIGFGADDPFTAATKVSAAIAASKLSTKTFGAFGDSISALFTPYWQAPVAANLGMTHAFNDAHGGRGTKDIFENYGGDGTGTYSGTPVGGAGFPNGNWQIGLTTGHTLAQDLAAVSVCAVFLGTNDGGYVTGGTVGTPGDAPSRTGSYCAVVAWVIQTLQAANPNMRIVWITPYQYNPTNGHGGSNTVAGNTALVNAIVGTCALWGVPVINLLTGSGINATNWSTALGDGLHPTTAGFANFLVPAITRGLLGYN